MNFVSLKKKQVQLIKNSYIVFLTSAQTHIQFFMCDVTINKVNVKW